MATYHFIKPRYVPKLWGYEACICNVLTGCHEKGYACKLLNLIDYNNVNKAEVSACSIHYHLIKTETFYVIRGRLFLQIYLQRAGKKLSPDLESFEDPRGFILHPGTGVTLEAHVAHRFWTQDIPTTVIEASTPDDASDSYRIVGSGRSVLVRTEGFEEIKPDGFPIL